MSDSRCADDDRLTGYGGIFADARIMSDKYLAVESTPVLDEGVAENAAVYHDLRKNRDVVPDLHAAEVRNAQPSWTSENPLFPITVPAPTCTRLPIFAGPKIIAPDSILQKAPIDT